VIQTEPQPPTRIKIVDPRVLHSVTPQRAKLAGVETMIQRRRVNTNLDTVDLAHPHLR
jgi:hypothetical protein